MQRERMVRLDTQAIDRARLEHGWTWRQLARACEFSPPTRTKIAQGRAISIRTAARVCRALRVPLRRALVISASVPAEEPSASTVPVEPVGGALRLIVGPGLKD
jgi:transcriptional regulator with XRE-family HTH domain